jgi:hypothetical protein
MKWANDDENCNYNGRREKMMHAELRAFLLSET